MKNVVVANATPVVSLCTIGHEDILQQLFHHIMIPKMVEQELRAQNKPGSSFPDRDWVEVAVVQNVELVRSLLKDLDAGEAETIALAIQVNADIVLIDEIAGYRIAKNFDLQVFRTLSLLKTAKNRQIIHEVRPLVEEMDRKGRWYSRSIIEQFLCDLGE